MKLKVFLGSLLAILLIFTGVSFVWSYLTVRSNVGKTLVSRVAGKATYKKKGEPEWAPVEPGLELDQGDSIKTRRHSFVDIHLLDGSLLRVKERSYLQLGSMYFKEGQRKISARLVVGLLMAKIKPGKGEAGVKFYTPTAVAGIRGTTLSVQCTSSSDFSVLRVLEGKVEWGGAGGESASVQVDGGQSSSFQNDLGAPSAPKPLTPGEIAALGEAVNITPSDAKSLAAAFTKMLSAPARTVETALGVGDGAAAGSGGGDDGGGDGSGEDDGLVDKLNRLLKKASDHRTSGEFSIIEQALTEYMADKGKIPDSLTELQSVDKRDLIDPWGQPYEYEHQNAKYTLRSFGPDKQRGTKDDIVKHGDLSGN